MTTREHEQTLNVWLAGLLRERGVNARQEVTHPGVGRIDVEVRIGPAILAVEAEHGQSTAKQAEAVRDADRRLEQRLVDAAIAVCYPDDTDEQSLPGAQFLWAVRDQAGTPPHWTTGNLEQLVSVIPLTPAQLGNPDFAAAALSSSLDGAVRRLGDGQKRELARALDLPRQTHNGRPARQPWDAPAKRALLVIATAVMFHSRLDSHRRELRPEHDNRVNPPRPFTDAWPPDMAQQCAAAPDPVAAFARAWDLILALDYKPIFETGRAALFASPIDPAFTAAIRDTAQAALTVAGDIAGLRHDLLGRIFHTVLDTARYDGSFYTTTPAATLLAALAINDSMCDWQNPDAIAQLRITDPACGTGTLLMAAAERIRDLAPQAEVNENLSRALIERVFAGYDINLTATHMAATTLGLLSPTTHFGNMKIGRAFLGVDRDGNAHLGSLEFLDRQPLLMPWPNATPSVSQVDSGERMAPAEPADLVIMNPPFTRDSLRHDQFSREDEKKLKDREKTLSTNKPLHLSHNGGLFLYLAEFLTKPDTGTIAVVLPLVGATNYATIGMRRYLAQQFHIDTIVASHDPERIYFSENTDIGEMLMICRRWSADKGSKPATRIINLARNPATPADAISVAWAINNNTVPVQGYGTMQEWPESRTAAGDWGAVQFLSPYLCEKFVALRSGDMFPVVALSDIAEIGPAGQYIRGTFDRSAMPAIGGMSALWYHKTDITRTMAAKTDTHIAAKSGKESTAQRLWEQRGTFLVPQRMRLNTVRALCVRLDTPALGSLWVPWTFKDSAIDQTVLEKAVCIYLNSSVGALTLLGDRTNKIPSYPHFSQDDLRKLMVPDFTALGSNAAAQLAAAYDAHAQAILQPLPQMDTDPTRRALDAAVTAALGLDGEETATIRRHLAAEPSVTGRRYGS